jgi:hypothetical protein
MAIVNEKSEDGRFAVDSMRDNKSYWHSGERARLEPAEPQKSNRFIAER